MQDCKSRQNHYIVGILLLMWTQEMQIGIVWLPNVWKSTLFNALTKSYAADAANFPFCTIEPNVGIVEVRDPRVEKLAEISHTQKTIYAAVNFVDIAGLVKWASQGEGLGNQFLSHIRECDAIVQVVRYFDDADVVHVEWKPDPYRDIEIINDELMIADLQSIEKKIPERERKLKWQDKEAQKVVPLLKRMQTHLWAGHLLITLQDDLSEEEKKLMKSFNFLTFKQFVYAVNVAEKDMARNYEIQQEFAKKLNTPVAIVCAKFETEMMWLSEEERELFVEEMKGGKDIHIPTLDDLIKLAFDAVGLMYYFTTGEKETRARTIKKWRTAPQAAGAIHGDFERWFIRAETVTYEKFVDAGGWSWAREKGYLRSEGKEYIVQDGDVMLFRFNV